jgi:hypothetical protein
VTFFDVSIGNIIFIFLCQYSPLFGLDEFGLIISFFSLTPKLKLKSRSICLHIQYCTPTTEVAIKKIISS